MKANYFYNCLNSKCSLKREAANKLYAYNIPKGIVSIPLLVEAIRSRYTLPSPTHEAKRKLALHILAEADKVLLEVYIHTTDENL